jgi:hypothetical protein
MDSGMLLIGAFCVPGLLALIAFVLFLFSRRMWPWLFRTTEVLSVLGLPVFFLSVFDFDYKNDCCNDTAFFSPAHRLSVYVVIGLCMAGYFICSYRKHLAPPIIEVVLNCSLIIGIALNVVMLPHQEASVIWLIGNAPVVLLFIMRLARNHQMFLAHMNDLQARNMVEQFCLGLLRANAFAKFPLLMVLCLPLLALIAGAMVLFGQRPDALVKAFTDTYKHGLSQLDYECEGVICDGHFLCTVAARGHAQLVAPERLGIRNGGLVICNRQLLVSNAFEELIQEHAPNMHRVIRRNYNRVGNLIHRHYHVLDHKWISDLIYVVMKPLEWSFLLVLYCCDRAPESRIARQYLSGADREQLSAASRHP